MNATLRNYLIETIKVHASEANIYIDDEQADLLTLKIMKITLKTTE